MQKLGQAKFKTASENINVTYFSASFKV
jgi:hypothetical protein